MESTKLFILGRVAAYHLFVDPRDLVGRSRNRELVDAREAFIRICRDELKMSYPHIAKALQRDHTSIMSLYKRRRVGDYEIEVILADYKARLKKRDR